MKWRKHRILYHDDYTEIKNQMFDKKNLTQEKGYFYV